VNGGELYHGVKAEYVLDGLKSLSTPQRLGWNDTGLTTEATLEFLSTGDEACVLAVWDESGSVTYSYSVPGQLRFSTADGRVDITIPSRASSVGGEEAWGPLEIGTVGQILAPQNGANKLDFAGLSQSRLPVVTFHSRYDETLSNGVPVSFGGLQVAGIVLKSGTARPEGPLCLANDLMGQVSAITSGDYVREGTAFKAVPIPAHGDAPVSGTEP
jgi:hypothetical protein